MKFDGRCDLFQKKMRGEETALCILMVITFFRTILTLNDYSIEMHVHTESRLLPFVFVLSLTADMRVSLLLFY